MIFLERLAMLSTSSMRFCNG
jgi:serine/threonine protein kinase